MVLYRVVCSAGKEFRDLGPPIPEFLVCLNYYRVFLLSPSLPLDVRVQMVVPPLAALLADAAGEGARNLRPVARSVLFDHRNNFLVLLWAPRSFDKFRV